MHIEDIKKTISETEWGTRLYTIDEILRECGLQIKVKASRTSAGRRLGAILRPLGWVRTRQRRPGGPPLRQWAPPRIAERFEVFEPFESSKEGGTYVPEDDPDSPI